MIDRISSNQTDKQSQAKAKTQSSKQPLRESDSNDMNDSLAANDLSVIEMLPEEDIVQNIERKRSSNKSTSGIKPNQGLNDRRRRADDENPKSKSRSKSNNRRNDKQNDS
jgi:hypothetical protein